MKKITIKRLVNGVITDPIDGMELSPMDYEYTETDMGENKVTFNIKIPRRFDGDGTPRNNEIKVPFSTDLFVDIQVNGNDMNPIYERYFLTKILPNGSKDTKSLQYEYSLIFGFLDIDLKRYRFRDYIIAQKDPDKPYDPENPSRDLDYNTKISFVGDIKEFVLRFYDNIAKNFKNYDVVFHQNGNAYSGRSGDLVNIASDTNVYLSRTIEFTDATLWEVLMQTYSLFKIRWKLEQGKKIDQDAGQPVVMNKIIFNMPQIVVNHVFEYGGGLPRLSRGGVEKIDRSSKETDIFTRLIGVGGDKNLPVNYFALKDIEFLTDKVYVHRPQVLTNLLPKCFRMYTFGYNDAINDGTGGWKRIFEITHPITDQTFLKWSEVYRKYDGGRFEALDFDSECVANTLLINRDWNDLSTRPYAFKAYLRAWTNYGFGSPYSPIDYVESTMKETYGIREGVLDINEEIYPSISNRWRQVDAFVETTAGSGTFDKKQKVYTRIDEVVHSFVEHKGEKRNLFKTYKIPIMTVTATQVDSKPKSETIESSSVEIIPLPGKPSINKEMQQLSFGLSALVKGYGTGRVEIEKEVKQEDGSIKWIDDLTLGGKGYKDSRGDEEIPTYEGVAKYLITATSINNKAEGLQSEEKLSFFHRFSESGARYRMKITAEAQYGVANVGVDEKINKPTGPKEHISTINTDGSQHLVDGAPGGKFNGTITVSNYFTNVIAIPIKVTFLVWTKDLGFDLSDKQYWSTNECSFNFTTGLLAGEDYVFSIIKRQGMPMVAKDRDKSAVCNCFEDKDRKIPIKAKVPSEYLFELKSSEADSDLGFILPDEMRYVVPTDKTKEYKNQPPNDLFVLLNIQLPFEYVYMAEDELERVNRMELATKDRDIPTFSVDFDSVFTEEVLKQVGNDGTIYDRLRAGNILKIQNRTLIDYIDEDGTRVFEYQLPIKSLTKSYKGKANAK